jgi:O-antigen/teichoic acid export membrane protein
MRRGTLTRFGSTAGFASPARLNAAASVFRALSSNIVLLLLPALMGKEAFGSYSYLLWISLFSSQVGVVGYPNIISRAQRDEPVNLPGICVITVCLQMAVTQLLILQSPIGIASLVIPAVLGIGGLSVINGIQLANLRRFGRFRQILAGEATAAICRLAGVGLVVWLGSVTSASLLYVEFTALAARSLALAVFGSFHNVTMNIAAASHDGLYLKQAIGLGGLGFVDATVSERSELFFLSYSADPLSAIGVFSFVLRISSLALFVPSAVLEAWFPAMARRNVDRTANGRMWVSFSGFYAAFGLACFAAIVAVTLLLFGQYFGAAMLVIVAFRIVEGVVGFFAKWIYARRLEKYLWFVLGVSAVVSLLSNFLFTIRFGLAGASIAYVITHSVLGVLTYFIYRKYVVGGLADLSAVPAYPTTEADSTNKDISGATI